MRLKVHKYIIPLKGWVYIIPHENDKEKNEVDLWDDYFFQFVKKMIQTYVWNDYYISGNKSLEFHMKNYSVPERIIVMNRKLNKKIFFWNKCIIFRTIQASPKHKSINLFQKFSAFTNILELEGIKFRCSNIELALVESALVSESEQGIDIGLLLSCIKKYKKVFKTEIFYEIGTYKYIMSFNRLKEISKPVAPDLAEIFLDIIKRNGWNFIGESLRAI